MFNSVDGVLPLTFPQMKAAYVLCMARPWFSAAPFVNDDQLPRGLAKASDHFVTLCAKVTALLHLSVPADIGTIIGADFTAAQVDEAACKIFDIYMERHVLSAPRRAKADWEPPLANKLKQRITADNPGLPTGYNLWGKLTTFLPACMQHGLVGTTASSEGRKVWVTKIDNLLHRAGVIKTDCVHMYTAELKASPGATEILNLGAYIEKVLKFATKRIDAKKKADAAAAAARFGGGGPASLGRQSSAESSTFGGGSSTFGGGGDEFGVVGGQSSDEEVEFDGIGTGTGTSFQRQVFHGTSLERILAQPTTEGKKWGVPGLRAQNYCPRTGNMYWVVVQGFNLTGNDKHISYNLKTADTSNTDPVFPFVWNARQLAGGFYAAEVEKGPKASTGGVNTLLAQNIAKLAEAAAAGGPKHGWSTEQQAMLAHLEAHAGDNMGTLIGLDGIKTGEELALFHRWVGTAVKSWATVCKAMPCFADVLTRSVDEYNFKWKSSFPPLLVLRLLAFDWLQLTEGELVSALLPLSEDGEVEEEAYSMKLVGDSLTLQQTAKRTKAKGGFSTVGVVNDIWVHLSKLFTLGHGINFTHGFISPLCDSARQLAVQTDCAVQPQRLFFTKIRRAISYKYVAFVRRAGVAASVSPQAGFGLYSADEIVALLATIQCEWNTIV